MPESVWSASFVDASGATSLGADTVAAFHPAAPAAAAARTSFAAGAPMAKRWTRTIPRGELPEGSALELWCAVEADGSPVDVGLSWESGGSRRTEPSFTLVETNDGYAKVLLGTIEATGEDVVIEGSAGRTAGAATVWWSHLWLVAAERASRLPPGTVATATLVPALFEDGSSSERRGDAPLPVAMPPLPRTRKTARAVAAGAVATALIIGGATASVVMTRDTDGPPPTAVERNSAEAAPPFVELDPCVVLTPADAARYIEGAKQERFGRGRSRSCTYSKEVTDGPGFGFRNVFAEVLTEPVSRDEFVSDPTFTRAPEGGPVEPLTGLADAAVRYLQPESNGVIIRMLLGQNVVSVRAADTERPQAEVERIARELAELVAERIRATISSLSTSTGSS